MFSQPISMLKFFHINCYYYTLNSLTFFWLAKSVQWIFEISAHDVITADIFTQLSCHVRLHRTRFQRVIMSTLHNSCCLPSVKKQKHDFQVFELNKTIIWFSFCDIQNNQGLSKGLSASASSWWLLPQSLSFEFWQNNDPRSTDRLLTSYNINGKMKIKKA